MSGLIVAGQQAAAARATGDDAVTALQQAIGVISVRLRLRAGTDAQGFNAADAWLGHVLAQMPTGLWTDAAALTAWDMLRKYRGQLAAAGIDYDRLPRPAGAGELEAGRREQAREHAREHARALARAAVPAGPLLPPLRRRRRSGHPGLPVRPGPGRRVPGDPGPPLRRRGQGQRVPVHQPPRRDRAGRRAQIEVTAEVRALAAIAAERAAVRAAQPQVRLDDTTARSSSTPRSTRT